MTAKNQHSCLARSFRSKPSLLIYLFFSKIGRQIKKLKQKPGGDIQQNIFTILTKKSN